MKRAQGFSLWELLIAVALVAVLAGILLPAIHTASRHTRAAACANNLRQLGVAFTTYAADHNGFLPDEPATEENPKGTGLQWDAQLGPILSLNNAERGTKTVFYCPESEKCTDTHFGRNYAYNQVIASNQRNARQRSAHVNPSRFLLLLEVQVFPAQRAWTLFGGKTNRMTVTQTSALGSLAYAHSSGMNILFADGHVGRRLPENPAAPDLANVLPKDVLWLNQ